MRASIITPTLAAVRNIDACILNVAAQGDVVLEHIIVDGGSRDGTVERVHELSRVHRHVRFIPGPDYGQSGAMNEGTDIARGEVIGILNADDFYEPGAVGRGVDALRGLPYPAFVAGNCRVVAGDGSLLLWNRPTDLRLESLLLGWEHAQFPCNPSAYFYHKGLHDLVGGYDFEDHFAMDLDFILKCAAQGNMRYVSEHWGNFRYMPGTKTYEDAPNALRRRAAILERHARRLHDRRTKTVRTHSQAIGSEPAVPTRSCASSQVPNSKPRNPA